MLLSGVSPGAFTCIYAAQGEDGSKKIKKLPCGSDTGVRALNRGIKGMPDCSSRSFFFGYIFPERPGDFLRAGSARAQAQGTV